MGNYKFNSLNLLNHMKFAIYALAVSRKGSAVAVTGCVNDDMAGASTACTDGTAKGYWIADADDDTKCNDKSATPVEGVVGTAAWCLAKDATPTTFEAWCDATNANSKKNSAAG